MYQWTEPHGLSLQFAPELDLPFPKTAPAASIAFPSIPWPIRTTDGRTDGWTGGRTDGHFHQKGNRGGPPQFGPNIVHMAPQFPIPSAGWLSIDPMEPSMPLVWQKSALNWANAAILCRSFQTATPNTPIQHIIPQKTAIPACWTQKNATQLCSRINHAPSDRWLVKDGFN